MQIPIKSRFLQLSEKEFFQFCQEMRDYRLERAADGTIYIMSPTGSKSGKFNFDIAFEFAKWNKEYKLGIAFDSSTGFTLPNKAVRSPDLSWIQMDRWNALSEEDQMGFAPIVPEFVIEIRSKSDSIETLKEKMKEYIAQGVKLGWLIDPQQQKVWIYRAEGSIEIKNSFAEPLSGESVLPGFVLNLSALWG